MMMPYLLKQKTKCKQSNGSRNIRKSHINNMLMVDGPAVSALGIRSRKLSNIGRSSDG
jgi:hypothetical protein